MGSQGSSQDQSSASIPEEKRPEQQLAVDEDDEPDEWDKRIFSTGCAEENAKMTDCYYEKKDWRACAAEMEQFKQCWKRHGNNERTETKDS